MLLGTGRSAVQKSASLARMAMLAASTIWAHAERLHAETAAGTAETGVVLGGQDTDNFNISLPGGLTTFVVILSCLIQTSSFLIISILYLPQISRIIMRIHVIMIWFAAIIITLSNLSVMT